MQQKSASGVKMLGAAHDNTSQACDPANSDLKHLGQAPVRASRHRIVDQSPPLHMQYQAFVTPKGRTAEQVKSESSPNASSTPSAPTEVDLSLKFHNSIPTKTERKYLGQAPARAQAAQVSSNGKSPTAAELSARKIDAHDAEYRASMHKLLQQLEDMSVSKQRITEEFRASQQLTAQALRRLDEECERRQQLQLRVIETEAALKILGQICEGKAEELESVKARLEMSECRAAKLEQQLTARSALKICPIENKSPDDDDVSAQSELDVSSCLAHNFTFITLLRVSEIR
jgi:hypothetical protein